MNFHIVNGDTKEVDYDYDDVHDGNKERKSLHFWLVMNERVWTISLEVKVQSRINSRTNKLRHRFPTGRCSSTNGEGVMSTSTAMIFVIWWKMSIKSLGLGWYESCCLLLPCWQCVITHDLGATVCCCGVFFFVFEVRLILPGGNGQTSISYSSLC